MNRTAILKTISWVLLTLCLCLVFFVSWIAKDKRSEVKCIKVEIEFTDSLKFIDEDVVKSVLDRNYGTYIGQSIDSLDLKQIEEIFTQRNSITGAQAWATDDGTLHLIISQRLPALRFVNSEGKGFYIDNEAYIFPLHNTYVADVPLIEGFIPVKEKASYNGFPNSEEDKEWLTEMLGIREIIKKNKKWFENVEQIRIIENGDIAFKTKTSEELFIFGTLSSFKEKTKMIDTYYHNIAGLKDYKSVNLKYKKQIICRTDI